MSLKDDTTRFVGRIDSSNFMWIIFWMAFLAGMLVALKQGMDYDSAYNTFKRRPLATATLGDIVTIAWFIVLANGIRRK